MDNDHPTCPICKEGEQVTEERPSQATISYTCPLCGSYQVPVSWAAARGSAPPDRKLSAWVREQNELGTPPQLTGEIIEHLQTSIPDYRPLEKELKLLHAIERKSIYPGDKVRLCLEEAFPLAYAESVNEFKFYLEAIHERGFISVVEPSRGNLLGRTEVTVMISPGGWDYLDKHALDLQEKTQAFVAMSFSSDMDSAWNNAIKPAIAEAGYTPYRIDKKPHTDRIDVKIMAEIKNSRFVVADFTENRHGVYFEAGYALGLGIPVIWCANQRDKENVHFDTSHYNHIFWPDEDSLRRTLFDFICAIIGKRR